MGGNQVLVSRDVRGQEATQQPTQDARERGARQGVCAAGGALRCSEHPDASEHGLGRPREPPGGRRQTRPRTAGRGGRPQGGGWTPWEGWGRPARGHEVLPTSGRGQRVTAADAATPRGTRDAGCREPRPVPACRRDSWWGDRAVTRGFAKACRPEPVRGGVDAGGAGPRSPGGSCGSAAAARTPPRSTGTAPWADG